MAVLNTIYDQWTINYGYDALSRLLSASYAGANPSRSYNYAYDRSGNRTQQVVTIGGTPTTTNYTYNGANQLTGDGVHTLTYDANGNMTNDGTNAYTWDRANRLLSMGGISNAYDGEGHRIKQTSGVNVTQYLLDLQPGLAVVLSDTVGANINRYIHGPTGIHARKDPSGNWHWSGQDALGSVRFEANGSLAVEGSQDFDPIGNYFNLQGTIGTSYEFTGEQRDGNHLLYLRNRYLNSALGIFASLDSCRGTLNRTMSLNGYSWVEGNIVNAVDPSGMIYELPYGWDSCYYRQTGTPTPTTPTPAATSCSFSTPTPTPTNTPTPTPTNTPTPTATPCTPKFSDCELKYLARASVSESSGTGSNAAMAGIMLSQINDYNRNSKFYDFKSVADSLGIPQPGAFNAYRTTCQSTPNYESGLFSTEPWSTGYCMAQAMNCTGNPLLNLTLSNFGVNNGNEQNALLRIPTQPTITKEIGFCSSVLDKIPDWNANYQSEGQYFVPSWYLAGVVDMGNYMLFRGSPRSVLVHDLSDVSPIHINWQCPQKAGQLTVWAITTNENPSSDDFGIIQCQRCDAGSIQWHPAQGGRPEHRYVKSCTGEILGTPPNFGCTA